MTSQGHDGSRGRLESVVRARLPGASRRLVRRLIMEGAVTLNGHRARKGDPVQPGDRIDVPPLPPLLAEPGLAVDVLAESPRLAVLAKPAPMATLPLDPREHGTLANFVVARWPECRGIGDDLTAGVLHRLDTGTSGIVLVARDADLWRAIRRDFASRRVEKRYVALVAGHPHLGVIAAPLAHDTADRRRMRIARSGERSWEAETEIVSVERRGLHAIVQIRIWSGVTHQIRAHLAGTGTPIVGDQLYGGEPDPSWESRHALHALSITLPPRDDAPGGTWEAPVPNAFGG